MSKPIVISGKISSDAKKQFEDIKQGQTLGQAIAKSLRPDEDSDYQVITDADRKRVATWIDTHWDGDRVDTDELVELANADRSVRKFFEIGHDDCNVTHNNDLFQALLEGKLGVKASYTPTDKIIMTELIEEATCGEDFGYWSYESQRDAKGNVDLGSVAVGKIFQYDNKGNFRDDMDAKIDLSKADFKTLMAAPERYFKYSNLEVAQAFASKVSDKKMREALTEKFSKLEPAPE